MNSSLEKIHSSMGYHHLNKMIKTLERLKLGYGKQESPNRRTVFGAFYVERLLNG